VNPLGDGIEHATLDYARSPVLDPSRYSTMAAAHQLSLPEVVIHQRNSPTLGDRFRRA
jgi:hypothetical protein